MSIRLDLIGSCPGVLLVAPSSLGIQDLPWLAIFVVVGVCNARDKLWLLFFPLSGEDRTTSRNKREGGRCRIGISGLGNAIPHTCETILEKCIFIFASTTIPALCAQGVHTPALQSFLPFLFQREKRFAC